jgi:ribosomal-protein-alanine N-acetyltransferase
LTRAGGKDATVLAAIHGTAFPNGESWSSEVFELQLEMPNVIGLTDSSDGLILVRTAGDEAEVLTLAVRPGARRRRLGTALLQEAILQATAAGANVLFLEVSIKNTAALALYRQFGFSRAGLRRRYYSDGTDALVLRRDLPNG